MKKLATPLLIICAIALSCVESLAQARRITTPPPTTSTSQDVRGGSALYDDASGYTARRFQEFTSKKLPFDPRVAEQTLKEQKELAARYAEQLRTRPNLAGEDLYYMGLLYNLSGNEERAIETFKRYIADKAATNEHAQLARYLLTLRAAQINRFEEAESALADYLRFEPRKTTERVAMENELTKAYRKNKQLERAVAHAEEAFKAAKSFQPNAQNQLSDRLLYSSSTALVDLYQELKKPDAALMAILEEVRKLAIETPSPRLYVDATTKMADLLVDTKRKPEAVKMIEDSILYVQTYIKNERDQRGMLSALQRKQRYLRLQGESAPEIMIAKWIEQAPTKISELKGHVVLLDFWATWCGPCLASFPHLREWNDKYKDRGLVIVGLTKYYGRGGGREMSQAEELGYLERFKKEYNLTYGVAVATNDDNHRSYGVNAIPTAVLIDRKGVIRLMTTGSGGGNEVEITAAIEKLLDESK
ncbi:MAG TPA: TlpA disulfide reductase family protein [Pyrinomonadaceae bacterium]